MLGRPTAGVLAAALVVLAMALPGAAQASCPSGTLGVYSGAGKTERVQDFRDYLGHPVAGVLDFLPRQSWRTLQSPSFWENAWAGSGHQIVLSVPMLPKAGGSLRAGARGKYDGRFKQLAHHLVTAAWPTRC